ncbi:Putative Holliday junction resolvase [Candidatus Rubidus massiliensis]|nr:MAG: Holliday junction resolvase [Chlamydia sp. 32-24]CDZ81478.1 Putative Holliday junction resolvase [Candidatus Rubidus massiliensis]
MKQAKRIIGIDFGMARIGLAYSDETQTIAFPLETFTCEKKSEANIIKLVKRLEDHQKEKNYIIEKIVVGMPLMMSGKVGFLADEVKHFVDLLQQKLSIPIVTWDERLTSVQAERTLRESTMSRKKRTQFVDRVAAVIILQNYLDSIHFHQ